MRLGPNNFLPRSNSSLEDNFPGGKFLLFGVNFLWVSNPFFQGVGTAKYGKYSPPQGTGCGQGVSHLVIHHVFLGH